MGYWCKKWDTQNSDQNQDTQVHMNVLTQVTEVTQLQRETGLKNRITEQYKLIT